MSRGVVYCESVDEGELASGFRCAQESFVDGGSISQERISCRDTEVLQRKKRIIDGEIRELVLNLRG